MPAEFSGLGLLAQRPMQPDKHIARIVSAHAAGEKGDIFLADRTRVEDLNILPTPNRFDKQF
jgi:hypothetical protein